MLIESPFGKFFPGKGFALVGPRKNLVSLFGLLFNDPKLVFCIPFGGYEHAWPISRDPDVEENEHGRILTASSLVANKNYFNFGFRAKKTVKVEGVLRYVVHTYLFIAFGKMLVNTLLAKMSEDTFEVLQQSHIIDENENYKAGRFYLLDISDLPLDNPSWAGPMANHLVKVLFEIENVDKRYKALLVEKDRRKIKTTSGSFFSRIGKEALEFYIEVKQQLTTEVSPQVVTCTRYDLLEPVAEEINAEVFSKHRDGEIIRELNKHRYQLENVRSFARLITFALDSRGSGVIPWEQGEKTARGKKSLRLLEFPEHSGNKLLRIKWEKTVSRPQKHAA